MVPRKRSGLGSFLPCGQGPRHQFFQGTAQGLVERPDDSLGGFVEVSIHPHAIGCDTRPVGYVEGWYVEPDLRTTGVGRSLLDAAESWARDRGCREMASDAIVGNDASVAAHQACGYTVTERLVHFRKRL